MAGNGNNRYDITKELLEELYNEKFLGTRTVARRLGASRSTIKKYLREYNISIRPKKMSPCYYQVANQRQEEIIYGGLMGDAGVYTENNDTARYSFAHSEAQIEYVKWLRKELSPLITNKEIKVYRYPEKNRTAINTASCFTSYFGKLRKLFYKDNKKIVNEDILNKLTPLSVAVWFMDDGSANGDLATCSFTYEEHLLMKEWFKNKYNIDVKIGKQYKNEKLYFLLSFNRENFYKLFLLIERYIIDSMKYKIEKILASETAKEERAKKRAMIQSDLTLECKSILETGMPAYASM